MQEEIFGPLLPIVSVRKLGPIQDCFPYISPVLHSYVPSCFGFCKVEDLEDSFEVINSKPKPLAAYLFTNDEQMKKKFVQNVSAGGMAVNDAMLHVICLNSLLNFTLTGSGKRVQMN